MNAQTIGSILLSLFLVLSSLPGGQPAEGGAYVFEKLEDDTHIAFTSKLMNIIDVFDGDYMLRCAVLKGQLLTLFGDPLYESPDLEQQYTYAIQCADDAGDIVYLSVYSGASGPAIGAHGDSPDIAQAALALVDVIMETTPMDYDYEGYYPDGPSRIAMGIRDGEPYYHEEEITDDEALERMFTLLYP